MKCIKTYGMISLTIYFKAIKLPVLLSIILVSVLFSCESPPEITEAPRQLPALAPDRYNAAFLIMDGVYNTELTAPYDIFQAHYI